MDSPGPTQTYLQSVPLMGLAPEGRHMTVGELQKALESISADRLILCRLVAADGSWWNVDWTFHPGGPGMTISIISVSHPELRSLFPFQANKPTS